MGRGGMESFGVCWMKGLKSRRTKRKIGELFINCEFSFSVYKKALNVNEWMGGRVCEWLKKGQRRVPLWIFPPLLSLLLYECFGWVCWILRCLCPRQLIRGECRAWRIWARNYLPTRNVRCGSLMQPCNCVTICNDDGWGGFSNATHATNQIQMRANYIFA